MIFFIEDLDTIAHGGREEVPGVGGPERSHSDDVTGVDTVDEELEGKGGEQTT